MTVLRLLRTVVTRSLLRMPRARPVMLMVLTLAGAHTLISHSHPWDGHHDHAVPAVVHAQAGPPAVVLQQVFGGLSQPLLVTHAGDGSGRLFIVEKTAKIKVAVDGQLQATPFLDLDPVVEFGGSEQGLLGLTFHPSYETNGRFFVYYTANNWDNTIARYQRSAADPNRADPASGRVLLAIPDQFTNHNGGMLTFGPGGYLYAGTGDGGSAGDPSNNAQNLTSLLGKMLRLDVDLAVDAAPYYEIPASNPYASRTDGTRREIWASGLRNPWRWSFDRQTGDQFVADVGQGAREEINLQPAGTAGGRNHGWRIMEGFNCYNPSSGCNQSGLTLPIQDYDHSLGCSVTGGYVYRGAAIPSLRGYYIFGDYCSGRIWALRQDTGGSWVRTQLLDTPYAISSFGEDEAGELYLTDLGGGAVYRFADPSAPPPTPGPTQTTGPTATPGPATPTPTTGTGPRADLTITAFSGSPTTADRPIPISVTVVNQGTANTGHGDSFDIHVFADLGRPPTASDTAYVGHIQVATLAPGASTTVTGEAFANALVPGNHTLWALADGHDIVTESNEGNNSRSTAITLGAPPTGTPVGTQSVTFDDRAGQDQMLNGQYPSGAIDWGTNKWYHSGPWGAFTTKSISFNTAGVTSQTFTFLTPRRLVSLRAYNGGSGDATITLSCAGQSNKQAILGVRQVATITTNWAGTCTTVTVGSTNGWDTNFDDLVIGGAATATPTPTATSTPQPSTPTPTPTRTPTIAPSAQTVTFDDRAGQNQFLNGQYPAGVIDWDSGQWFHSGPFGSFTTKSISFTQGGTTRTFTFVTPRRLVSIQAYNGGSGSSTISLSCSGQPTKTVTVAARQLVTIATGWSGTCTTITIGGSNGWDTNFDTLIHDGG